MDRVSRINQLGWRSEPSRRYLMLLDAITAGLEARCLGAIVIGQVATHRPAPSRSRIISELRDRPAIALVPVPDLLILALAVLRIDHQFGRRLPLGLTWCTGRLSYGPILAHGGIPQEVRIVRVIVRNAAVPIG